MNNINFAAEMFATRIFTGVNRRVVALGNRGESVNREVVEGIVSRSVRRNDIFGRYQNDRGRMVEYITNSICSSLGLE